MKLLVHFHVYYQEQVPWFMERLSSIGGCEWDLVVTSSGLRAETVQLISAFKPGARFIVTENVGYDVWPFISMLRQVSLEDYDLVMKLHTKGENNQGYTINGLHLMGYEWRNYLVDALLKTPERFGKCLNLFEKDPRCGIVFERALKRRLRGLLSEEGQMLRKEMDRAGLKRDYKYFCAGTMFIARAKALVAVRDLDVKAEDFPAYSASHSTGSLAHVYERIIPFMIQGQGYRIRTVTAYPLQATYVTVTKAIEPALGQIFRLEHVPPEDDKVLTLFGMHFTVSRKK